MKPPQVRTKLVPKMFAFGVLHQSLYNQEGAESEEASMELEVKADRDRVAKISAKKLSMERRFSAQSLSLLRSCKLLDTTVLTA